MRPIISVRPILGLLLLLFSIGFNLWVYRMEPTATTDPNDNTFQYALVERTNQIWDFAQQTCSAKFPSRFPSFFGYWNLRFGICQVSYLADHWVPNWAGGYNLPYYYAHLPQITIVASWRFLSWIIGLFGYLFIGLFTYYHIVIYLLLCLFPLSVFLALRIIGLSILTAGFGALVSTQLSTNGLYGIDPSSFLWRGYGLSSQLFAMLFFPLALAFAWKYMQASIEHRASSIEKPSSMLHLQPLSSMLNHQSSKFLLPAILFLSATTAGHLGIGMIAFLSVGVLALYQVFHSIQSNQVTNHQVTILRNLFLLYSGVILLLGYWIIPTVTDSIYHNTSFWDPVWKFDSYGVREVLANFFNGDLLDYGRFPTLTILTIIGLFTALSSLFRNTQKTQRIRRFDMSDDQTIRHSEYSEFSEHFSFPYSSFSILFLFWLFLYFGRTTWGGILNIIPGMSEFHLSRFIVGVQMTALFLIPIGVEWIINFIILFMQGATKFVKVPACRQAGLSGAEHLSFQNSSPKPSSHSHIHTTCPELAEGFAYLSFVVFAYFLLSPQTIRFASHNDVLITRANTNFSLIQSDVSSLIAKLLSLQASSPGRVYFGRGGNWGKDFRIAETPAYIYYSTFGIPTLLWLPETWSPLSDVEQHFTDTNPAHYALWNVRYVVTPPSLASSEIRPFWKLLESGKTWKLYEIDFSSSPLSPRSPLSPFSFGYFSTGIRPAAVASDKLSYKNLVRSWLHSDYPSQALFPQLILSQSPLSPLSPQFPIPYSLPRFTMRDEVTYQVPDGTTHNLFSEIPVYISPSSLTTPTPHISPTFPIILSESSDTGMVFRATVEVPGSCPNCMVILKQTYHPSWKATVDGAPAPVINVFPFYNAVLLETQGNHEVVLSYQPSRLKVALLIVSMLSFTAFLLLFHFSKQPSN